MVILWNVIWIAKCLTSIEKCVWPQSNVLGWINHVLTHHVYWVCQIWPSKQHGIHQESHGLLIRNLHHFIILVHILLQLCLGIKWHLDGFVIFHAKAFQNLLEIPILVDVKKTLCTIPFHFRQGRNVNRQDLSFWTFEKVLPSLAKTCFYSCTPRWDQWHRW